MTSQETNPFASPQAVSQREAVQLAAMPPTTPLEEESWPYEATELAKIEEIPRPWGRPISVARKWGNGRWLGIFLSSLAFIYFTFSFIFLLLSSSESTRTFANMGAIAATVALFFGLMVPYLVFYDREDVSDRGRLRKLIRKRKEAIDPLPESDDPVFVMIVPRTRWVFSRAEMTAYVANAHIDPEQKRLFLDADQFRFRIPVNSLLDVSVEPLRKYPTTYWFVRLVIQTQEGPQELCFRLGNTDHLWQTDGQREAEAKEYRNRILLLKKAS
ncbi:hypothetical protein [Bremerella sp. P1]|uniref:hypothetical protein n=1 Tax=Bremerella sp. P1 TaxID=3026424 RepID=UPI002367FFDB|nr:hypothetical protein [Bremerella sp. P1]WDI43160.1 hypothetical protein PSR63_04275 [Bremerella sp. P1]